MSRRNFKGIVIASEAALDQSGFERMKIGVGHFIDRVGKALPLRDGLRQAHDAGFFGRLSDESTSRTLCAAIFALFQTPLHWYRRVSCLTKNSPERMRKRLWALSRCCSRRCSTGAQKIEA
jgi:hypothetical protein